MRSCRRRAWSTTTWWAASGRHPEGAGVGGPGRIRDHWCGAQHRRTPPHPRLGGDVVWPAKEACMAAMKPRTGEGPLEVTKEGRGLVMRVPLEGGGRLVVELSPDEAAALSEALKGATS